jgi:tetrahydromethanopterin S-methyltransferase subunit G
MERTMWTDERLDERFNSVDKRLDDLERRMDAGFERVDRDIRDLRQLMLQLWGATMATQLAVIVAVIVTNS